MAATFAERLSVGRAVSRYISTHVSPQLSYLLCPATAYNADQEIPFIDTGEKPYVCDWPHCHRQFSVQSNLKRHAKVHYEAAAALTSSKQVAERHHGLPRMERHHSDIARS